MNTSLIITTTTYLLLMALAFWVVSKTGWWTKIFAILYVIAILPNLAALATEFTIDRLIMAWFDSIYLYILLPLYVIIQLLIRMGERGWLGNWLAKRSSGRSRPLQQLSPQPSVETYLLTCIQELEEENTY
ncbi:MAG: hypothetical protein ACTSRL_14355 [Candidatus Helarchaeota archaeon]|nr:hypothetical protein [Deltaproteobacteria bacterium]